MVRRAVKQGVSFCRETSVLIVSKETIRGIIPAASTSREAEYPAQTAPMRSQQAVYTSEQVLNSSRSVAKCMNPCFFTKNCIQPSDIQQTDSSA